MKNIAVFYENVPTYFPWNESLKILLNLLENFIPYCNFIYHQILIYSDYRAKNLLEDESEGARRTTCSKSYFTTANNNFFSYISSRPIILREKCLQRRADRRLRYIKSLSKCGEIQFFRSRLT